MGEKFAARALVFDAYGTLFDVRSIETDCEGLYPGKGAELTRLWRAKQLEYSWLRSLMGRYEEFEAITRDSLAFSCRVLGLTLADDAARHLLDRYRRLALFPDVAAALASLGNRKKAILSNGSPAMLNALVENSGIGHHFDAVISVDELKTFKPSRSVYQLVVRHLGVAIDETGFVSSNFWDAAGATNYGFRTFWINRARNPAEELGILPWRIVSSLDQIGQSLA